MSKKRYVDTKFWDDSYVSSLSALEKLLFLYLITSPLTGISGVYEMPIRKIAFDTGLEKDFIAETLQKYQADEKIFYFEGWIVVRNFIKNQAKNPKIEAGIERELKQIPDSVRKAIEAYESLSHLNRDRDLNRDSNRDSNLNGNPKPAEEKKPKLEYISVTTLFDEEIKAKYAKSTLDKFVDYWDQAGTHHKTTIAYWQKQKVFDVKRRLATWKRNEDERNWERTQRAAPRPSEEPVRKSREGTDSGFSSIGSLFSKKI